MHQCVHGTASNEPNAIICLDFVRIKFYKPADDTMGLAGSQALFHIQFPPTEDNAM